MESYMNGERGNNVLFNNQARVHLEAMKELHQVAFQAARDVTKVKDGSLMGHYLNELERYSLAKKINFNDMEKETLETFDFDFAKMESDDFNTLPKEISSTEISFLHEEEQKQFFA